MKMLLYINISIYTNMLYKHGGERYLGIVSNITYLHGVDQIEVSLSRVPELFRNKLGKAGK